jgi:hypothetical protein
MQTDNAFKQPGARRHVLLLHARHTRQVRLVEKVPYGLSGVSVSKMRFS